jgi:hypothetical protein
MAARPNVISTTGRWSLGSNGRISTRSVAAPPAAMIAMATMMETHTGQPHFVAKAQQM